jgi:hypothetical protein
MIAIMGRQGKTERSNNQYRRTRHWLKAAGLGDLGVSLREHCCS